MTGRRLYELVTSELAKAPPIGKQSYYGDTDHHSTSFGWFQGEDKDGKSQEACPPAFDFLYKREREAWNRGEFKDGNGRVCPHCLKRNGKHTPECTRKQ